MSRSTRNSRSNKTDVYSQSSSGSLPDNDKTQASLVELHLNNLYEGNLIKKDDLLTPVDDTDYIDDYIESNIVEDLYNIDIEDNKTSDEISIETHIKTMLNNIKDEELRSKLERVVYKYTNVFSTELSSTPALIEP